MRQTTQPDTLSRYILAALCGIVVAIAGILIGYGSVYVQSWSLVIIEQEVDGSEAVNVPGLQYQVTYQVRAGEDTSEPREDVRIQSLGCGRTLIRTPLLVGAREVTFYVASKGQLPQQAYRCRDGSRVAPQPDAPQTTILVALRPSIELPLERWYALSEGHTKGGMQ
jgi:hypothetical protein